MDPATLGILGGMAVLGGVQGWQDAKNKKQENIDRRNIYARMALAGRGSNIPGGGVVRRAPAPWQGALAGLLKGAQGGGQMAGMAQGLGLTGGGGEQTMSNAALLSEGQGPISEKYYLGTTSGRIQPEPEPVATNPYQVTDPYAIPGYTDWTPKPTSYVPPRR